MLRGRRASTAATAAALLVACTAGDVGGPTRSTPAARPPPAVRLADAQAVMSSTAPAGATPPQLALAVRVDGPAGTVAGLDLADTVVEYPRPGATSGVLAITAAADGVIGPLRPASHVDVALARTWAADLVTTTAPGVAATATVVHEEGAPPGVVLRDPARRAPHNAYAVVAAARAATPRSRTASGPTARPTGPPRLMRGHVTNRLAVEVGGERVTWRHDPRRGAWIRSASDPAATQVDGAPIAAGSVVVAELAHPLRVAGLRGRGDAIVLRDGLLHVGRWVVDADAAPLRIERRDGTALPLEGPLWLHLCAAPCGWSIPPAAPQTEGAPR